MTDTSLEQAQSSAPLNFTFTAKGGDFFGIAIKNIFLSILTLGIYWFWGKVEITKYLYNNTRFQNHNFDYHATGKERFIGFLKAVGILLVYGIFIGIVSWGFRKSDRRTSRTNYPWTIFLLSLFLCSSFYNHWSTQI